MNKITRILLSIVLVIIILGGAYVYWQNQPTASVDFEVKENTLDAITNENISLEDSGIIIDSAETANMQNQNSSATEEISLPSLELNMESTVPQNWQTYQNDAFGFKISYPQNWVYEERENMVYFGTPESKYGGYLWGLSVHQSEDLEKVIAEVGDQFEDRKESRMDVIVNNTTVGTMVTVTADNEADWIAKSVYIENNDRLFVIGNGAIDDDMFETFYKSFEIN